MSCTELDRSLQKTVNKREEWKEKKAREEQAARDEATQLGFGGTDMCKEELKKIIDSDRRMYYRTEELNDKLYIHYKGWKEFRGLEGWTGLRALYAECNAFDRIQGLHMCTQLRSLFLSENCIKRIEGLDNCTQLWSLNLSNNFIERIEGLSKLTNLNTLIIAKNKIGFAGVDDLLDLAHSSVCSLDVQDNKIWDPDVLPEVFAQMPNLRVLYLKGNPCGKKIPNYRKSITVYCEDLKYLDDRPVFEEDRRAAEAFNRGGLEEERAERRRIRDETNAKHDANMKAFQAMIDGARAEKRERDAMRVEDKYTDETDPVESQEQRMKKQVDKWKEENADDLKDDAKEHALRCLKSERERNTQNGVAAAEAEQDNEGSRQEEDAQGAGCGDEKPQEDNRKLVYEDIWDEAPTPWAKSSSAQKPSAKFAPPSRSAAASTPSAGGLVSSSTSSAFVEDSRKQALQSAVDAGKAPAWYAKFAEIAGKTAPGVGDGGEAVVPGPAAGQRESKPLAAQSSPGDGAELDEMD